MNTAACCLLFILTPARADGATPDVAARLKAFQQAHRKSHTDFAKVFQKLPVGWPRAAALQFYRALNETYARRAVDLAEANPSDPAAVDALNWAVGVRIGSTRQTCRAYDLLLRDHVASDKLRQALTNVTNYGNECKSAAALAEAVLRKSPHRDMRGLACFKLAELRQRKASLARRLREGGDPMARLVERQYGKALGDELRAADPDRLDREAEELYETVVRDYGTVKYPLRDLNDTLGAVAGAVLFEMRYLSVGKVAPEIEGEDLDGKKFKLSDYRGKVVVLDFWGNW